MMGISENLKQRRYDQLKPIPKPQLHLVRFEPVVETEAKQSQNFADKMTRYRAGLSDRGLSYSPLHALLLKSGREIKPIEFWSFREISLLFGVSFTGSAMIALTLLVGALSNQFWDGAWFAFKACFVTGGFVLGLATGPAIAWHILRTHRRQKWPSWDKI